MSDLRTCRYCHRQEHGLMKYGTRAYAHGRCLFMNWTPKGHEFFNLSRRQRTLAVLDKLPVGLLGRFRMCDFDRTSGEDSMSSVGISACEFMDYWNRRREDCRQ